MHPPTLIHYFLGDTLFKHLEVFKENDIQQVLPVPRLGETTVYRPSRGVRCLSSLVSVGDAILHQVYQRRLAPYAQSILNLLIRGNSV